MCLAACQSKNGENLKTGAASGYSYKVYKTGNGQIPNVGDQVYFNMDIYDDSDSLLQTYREQQILPSMAILAVDDLNRKKNAILDVLSDLSVGDSVGIIVPIDSVPNLPPGFSDIEYIEYRIVSEEILSKVEHQAKMDAIKKEQTEKAEALKARYPDVEALAYATIQNYKAGRLSDLQETPNGVKYFIHEKGDGILPTKDRMVSMLYHGSLMDPIKKFDDSFTRGRGYSFRVGQGSVIKGWDEAALHLPVGTKASLFIPAEMGYGAQGFPPEIPGGSELYFYVEVDELLF